MMSQEEFLEDLRFALNNLHDPDRLGRSRLAALFGVRGRLSSYSELQDILTSAIQSIRPSGQVPPGARSWRIYELLHCRYVQEMSASQVAHQLGLSVRHLHREQAAAIDALGQQLWAELILSGNGARSGRGGVGIEADAATTSLADEVAWLRGGRHDGPANLCEVLEAVVELAAPLAASHDVKLQYTVSDEVSMVAVHPVGLKQILLSLTTAAVHQAEAGLVDIQVRKSGWDVIMHIECPDSQGSEVPASAEAAAAVNGAAELATLCGMRLWTSHDEGPFGARLAVPAAQGAVVLAVDDNEDALRLMDRYLFGTRYRLVAESDPERALEAAQSCYPVAILLDVMMPQVDGWRVLGRLRSHPATRHIPVVVCTILSHAELALTLGAASCLQKPISQQVLLQALDSVLEQRVPVSR